MMALAKSLEAGEGEGKGKDGKKNEEVLQLLKSKSASLADKLDLAVSERQDLLQRCIDSSIVEYWSTSYARSPLPSPPPRAIMYRIELHSRWLYSSSTPLTCCTHVCVAAYRG